ncbi:MAG: radical SAM protein [Treponema sp.]|nr:radical SAM protein [Treponema sp.]
MNVVIIQPPLVQLNTAYPSGAYLASFFRQAGHTVQWFDLSIQLFSQIFCKKGLETLFSASTENALQIARKALEKGDEATASNLYRYISQKDTWIQWIDSITAILKDGSSTTSDSISGRELCHRFLFSPHAPRGSRMESYLENADHEPSIDDARFLASLALADLADYITVAFDPEFALVRYGESLAISETSFTDISKGIKSPVLETFYKPLLDNAFAESKLGPTENEKLLVCISIPFPGTFTAGLLTAQYFKNKYKDNAFIVMGGGFVNTELRDTEEKQLASFINAISYDRGYGSYQALFLSGLLKKGSSVTARQTPLYKLRLFQGTQDGTALVIAPNAENDVQSHSMQEFEDSRTSEIVPDYRDIDFSQYPRMTDDTNPMQRIWSDGTWIKAYLAHGCYWHQCAFCDVTLDYVASYRLTHIQNLFYGLKEQAVRHGIYGIHFVDEAMPPKAMTQFAELNAKNDNSLSFWGNIRFEKVFSRDIADFLSYGGLIGVSGGIEIATGSGLDDIHKGTDIHSIVNACCAFKEAGILVHAYMIYGYWKESEQDLINSMETLRQFYAAGLLDSSFWHKFTLTRHSRIYKEWQEGKHPELQPIIPKNSGMFAKNGLHFAGEQKSQKFGKGLNAALTAWMHGEALEDPVGTWFSFKTPRPTIPQDYIEKAIKLYEKERDSQYKKTVIIEKCWWLAGLPVPLNKDTITWIYMQERIEMHLNNFTESLTRRLCECIIHLTPEYKERNKAIKEIKELSGANQNAASIIQKLRGKGLVQI